MCCPGCYLPLAACTAGCTQCLQDLGAQSADWVCGRSMLSIASRHTPLIALTVTTAQTQSITQSLNHSLTITYTFLSTRLTQVHYYLPNAIGFADIFITKQRQQEAAARAGPQQQQSGSNQRLSLGSEASSLLQESSFGTSAAGVRDMLLTASNAAVAAANAAAAAEAAAADGTSMQWAKGGWAMEFDLAGCGASEGEDEAVVTSRGVAANFKAVHR